MGGEEKIILEPGSKDEERIPWEGLFELERGHLNKQEQALIDFARQSDNFQSLCDDVESIIVKAWISPDWETLFIEDERWNRAISRDWGNIFYGLEEI